MLIALSLPACVINVDDDINDDDDNVFNCVDGDGDIVSEELTLEDFTGIELSIDARITITQGSPQKVVVEAQQNIIDLIELDVDDNVWEVTLDDCIRNFRPIRIFVTMEDIEKLNIEGSGEIIGDNGFVVDDLDLNIAGSGDMDLGFEADDVDINIVGSGDMDLEGSADELDLSIAGSGNMNAFDLTTQDANINITGSGDARLRVEGDLKVNISGSGDVLYKGTPSLEVNVLGSGRVIDAN